MALGGIFHDFLEGPWEEARGFLREELEQLYTTLKTQQSTVFFARGQASTLLGRRSGSPGAFDVITLGENLLMTGTVLSSPPPDLPHVHRIMDADQTILADHATISVRFYRIESMKTMFLHSGATLRIL